ncbi:MAG: hypothetical protein ACTTH5_03560 [Wolinella sp.]
MGFLSKLLILQGLADHQLFLPILAIFTASLFESVLYLRIISILYTPKSTAETPSVLNLTHLPMIILGVILLTLGLIPSILFLLVGAGLKSLYRAKSSSPRESRRFNEYPAPVFALFHRLYTHFAPHSWALPRDHRNPILTRPTVHHYCLI